MYLFLTIIFACFTGLEAMQQETSSSSSYSSSSDSVADIVLWRKEIQLSLIFGTVLIYYVLAVAFAIYGGLILHRIVTQNKPNYLRTCKLLHDVFPRVIAITMLCTCCFICRGTVMVVLIDKPVSQALWWFDLAYFTSMELLPLVMMLILLRVQNTKSSTSPSTDPTQKPLLRDKSINALSKS
ncbi:hypothetical protein Pelo_13595 [Pelomyxa schiedti]|nr:hypothetical protein Pelo_13595 [Pelomyxa schiedti]